MAKKIIFESSQNAVFETLFQCFHGNAKATKREEVKCSDQIITALEDISIVSIDVTHPEGFAVSGFPDSPEWPRKRELKPEGGYIVLEDQAFEFLKKALNDVQALPVLSRRLARVWELLDSAKSGDMKKLIEEQLTP